MENKKNSKKIIVILIAIILILVIIFVVYFTRKLIMINKIKTEIMSNLENMPDNYSLELSFDKIDGTKLNLPLKRIVDTYYNDTKISVIDEYRTTIIANNELYELLNTDKIYYKTEWFEPIQKSNPYKDVISRYSLDDNIFKLAFNLKILATAFDGVECYEIIKENKDTDSKIITYVSKNSFEIKAVDMDSLLLSYELKDLQNNDISIEKLLEGYTEVDYDTYREKSNSVK